MMHNTYISCSSSITSLRTTFIAFNDYPIERCPLNYSCSCCCSFPVNSTRFNLMLPVNINPNLLYGLRQSTLINFPPSRRLVLGSSDRSSIYDVGRCRCCCCCGGRGGGGGEGKYLGRNCKEGKSNNVDKIRGRVIRRERERERDFRCNALGDAEAMLSLLSEEGVGESVVVRERRKRLNAGASALKKQNVLIEKDKDVKVSVLWGSGYLESKCKKERLVSSRDAKRRGERESIATDDSLSGSDKCETDNEVDVKHERFGGESLSNKRKGSRKMGGVVISEVKNDVLESYKDEKDQKLRSSRGDNVRIGSSAEWDWRKKSEKKLTDESTEFAGSREESIMRQSKLSQVHEASSSKEQSSNVEEESTLDVSSRRQSRTRTRKDDSVTGNTKFSGQHEHSVTDLRLHELSNSHIKTGNQVSEHLVSGNQREQSTSVASSSGQSKSRMTIDNQATEYLKSSWEHDQSSQTNRQNVESAATTMRRPIPEKGAVIVGQLVEETGCDYCRTCGKSMQENESEVNIEHHAEVSEIHGDARWTTSIQSQSESRRNKQEMVTSSSQTLVKEGSKEWNELHLAAGQVDARKTSGKYSETLESDYSTYDQGSLRSPKQPEMQIKILGDNSTSVESRQDVKKLKEGGGRATKEIESHNLLQTGINDSQVHLTSVEINRPSASGKINDEKIYLASKLKSVKEYVEKHKLVDEAFVQTGNFSGDAETCQPTFCATSQTGAQQVTEVEVKSDLQVSAMRPSFQLIELNSSGSEPESSLVRRNSTGRTTRVDSDGGSSRPQARRSSFVDKANKSGTGLFEDSSPEDAISSLERMHESSAQIVGEFVETMRHDSSASKTSIDKELSQVDKKHMLTGSSQLHVDEALVVKQQSSHVSGGSGTKVVVDDTQDAKDNNAEEALESEFVVRRPGKSLWNIVGRPFRLRWGSSSVTQKSSVKTSQHSLLNDSESDETWFSGNEHDEGTDDRMQGEQITLSQEPTSSNQSLIMGNATRSRQENRTKKESASMPQQPVSEQSLIKENATRRRKKDRIGKEQRNTSQEPTLDQSLLRSSMKQSQKGDSGLLSLDDRPRPLEGYVSSPASASQGGSISGSVSIGSNTDSKMTQQTLASSPLSPLVPSAGRLRRSDAFEESEEISERFSSTSEQRESSSQDLFVSSAGQLRRSDAFEESKKARINEELISSTSELKSDSVDVTESVVPSSEETDAQRKQRKLLRSKQVLSDRFDEWEEAFKRENELRKIDEIFMREALGEALKAADSWEVPVGAVLVQNEKIIARGYNLVEALRDSTAHAEMICIREASNALRTWRLSETTLYVTLEPCPMCAGAILQARIGTLVWGAPNKLLGADGSWIRLFPGGVEGEVRSEVADKPAAPAHPFHPNMKIRRGVLESECAQAMQQFFQLRRKKEKEKHNKSEEEGQPPCLPVAHKPVKLLRKMHGVFHKT
ncbi:uncharacterized protein LOC141644019 [Silene latifolia]|uniref:uncharacterized protein LOC141644019 n=1 Tax=Silene latifolia TaxID=37657 RepID=UPI003D76FB7F